jgi:hypothetical protein
MVALAPEGILSRACTAPIFGSEVLSCRFVGAGGRSCRAVVLVDGAAKELFATYGGVEVDHDGRVVVGWMLVEALVWTVPVEVAFVLAKHGSGVVLVVDQDPVGALGADGAHEAFRERVCPRRPRRRLDHVDALGGEHRIEGSGELGIAVADEETGTRRLARPGP